MTKPNRVDTALKAEHVYICGNSGTGKSSHIKELIQKATRVIVFDPDDEYGSESGFVRVESAAELVALLASHQNKSLKVAYVGEGKAAFEFWCKCAFSWARCLAVAEEIADVTTPMKAPPFWGRLIRRGRKYGIKICAVTQRPAEADKTILSNAAVIRVCALGRENDRVAIAKEIQYDSTQMAKMLPLEWLEFKRADLSLRAGKLGAKRTKILRR